MQNNLRTTAEARLKEGTAPVSRGWTTGAQALTLLHRLASSPESAGDALKLLHELQVHQVELDLPYEQAEQDSRQLADDLKNSTALFELAPICYLTLDPEGRVMAANRMAENWLAANPGEAPAWAGRRIEDLLGPECGIAVRGMLNALRHGGGQQTCAVQTREGGASARAVATATPGGEQVLMVIEVAAPGGAAGH